MTRACLIEWPPEPSAVLTIVEFSAPPTDLAYSRARAKYTCCCCSTSFFPWRFIVVMGTPLLRMLNTFKAMAAAAPPSRELSRPHAVPIDNARIAELPTPPPFRRTRRSRWNDSQSGSRHFGQGLDEPYSSASTTTTSSRRSNAARSLSLYASPATLCENAFLLGAHGEEARRKAREV